MAILQQNELLSIFLANSYIDISDSISTCITSDNKNYAQVVATILAFKNDKNLQINNSLKAFIKHCSLKFDGVCWFVIEPYDENYEEVRKLIEENMSNAQ